MNTNTNTNADANAGTAASTGTSTSTGTGTEARSTTLPTTKQTNNPLKAAAATLHGAGEVARGTFNRAVEGAFNESGGVAKNDATTSAGIDEIETGRFSAATKNREGAVPGSDHEVRKGI